MVAAFNDMQKIWRFHLGSNALQKIQWTERVARALNKKNGRVECAQNLVAKFCPVAHRTQRVPETN